MRLARRWAAAAQRFLKAHGLEVHRTSPGTEYMQCAPYGYSTYRPWFEEAFLRTYAEIEQRTEVTADRAYVLRQMCLQSLHVPGDVAECGVYRGGTARLLASTVAQHAKRVVHLDLFDTFSGMPDAADHDPGPHRAGDFGDTSLASVERYLADFPNVVFHPGVIPATFEGLSRESFAFVHVDVDLYSSVRDCCRFFYRRLTVGGVMVFDDYGLPHYRASARRAVDEFFVDKRERPLVLATGQCLVVKLPD